MISTRNIYISIVLLVFLYNCGISTNIKHKYYVNDMKKELLDIRRQFIDTRTEIVLSPKITESRLIEFYEPYTRGLTYELNAAIEFATSIKYSEASDRRDLRIMIDSLNAKLMDLVSIYRSDTTEEVVN